MPALRAILSLLQLVCAYAEGANPCLFSELLCSDAAVLTHVPTLRRASSDGNREEAPCGMAGCQALLQRRYARPQTA